MFESRDTRTESQPPFGTFTADVREICRPVYLPAEIPAFSMGRRAMSDEGAARAFAKACLNRMVRIYNECWKQMA